MRNVKDCSKRIETLVALLSETNALDVRATIGVIDAKSDADEVQFFIHFTGRDTPLLTANNGRVLDAIEHLAADILELTEAERHSLQVDAGSFLADQEIRMRQVARSAASHVRFTGTPHVFPPMCFRDRRLLEQELVTSGLGFETLGNESARWIVLLPNDLPISGGAFAMEHFCN